MALHKHMMASFELRLHSALVRSKSLLILGSVFLSYESTSCEEITLRKQKPCSPLYSFCKIGLAAGNLKTCSFLREVKHFTSLNRSATLPVV